MNTSFLTDKTDINTISLHELSDFRSSTQNLFLHACHRDDLAELEQLSSSYQNLLFMIQSIMEHTETQLGDLSNIIFELGALTELLTLSEKLHEAKKISRAASRPQTAYKDQIVEILYQSGPLMHKSLAEKLGITPNNLSNVIRRLKVEETPLIEETAVGKYKYYTLNSTGRQYIKEKLDKQAPLIVQGSCQSILPSKGLRQIMRKNRTYTPSQNQTLKQQIKTYSDKPFCQPKSSTDYATFSKNFVVKYRQNETDHYKLAPSSIIHKQATVRKEEPSKTVLQNNDRKTRIISQSLYSKSR